MGNTFAAAEEYSWIMNAVKLQLAYSLLVQGNRAVEMAPEVKTASTRRSKVVSQWLFTKTRSGAVGRVLILRAATAASWSTRDDTR